MGRRVGEREDFVDACEQHGPEIAGTRTWLGSGCIAPFGRRWERRIRDVRFKLHGCEGERRLPERLWFGSE